jgi:ABC-type dipeptide/oligopeptide/nickel transport system permease subunit
VIIASMQFMAHILIVELLMYFIGIGYTTTPNQATPPSWGNLIPNIRGDNQFKEYYWTWFFPISTIALTTISLRLISEGLRIEFDPIERS